MARPRHKLALTYRGGVVLRAITICLKEFGDMPWSHLIITPLVSGQVLVASRRGARGRQVPDALAGVPVGRLDVTAVSGH